MELPAEPHRRGALACLFALLAVQAAQAAPGRTTGIADVSPDGEASYSIPLSLPPGTNGLSPILSLDYRHRVRGGLLGVGWSLGGLSQVARCARTVAQDGVAEPPGRFAEDRFCLDGQRLVILNGAPYGSVNAEYRTEIESFSRVRSVGGSMVLGPASFVVERADGRIYEYGATADSNIDGRSTPPDGGARTWALSRIRDRAGNVIDYRYTEASGSTAFRIASIRYNANPSNGVAASHEVAFVYKERPNREVDAGYVAGMPVRQVVRLDRIDVLHEGNLVRSYNLDYEAALSSGGRSRLARVRECGAGGGDCYPPTNFDWQDGAEGMSATSAFSAPLPVGMVTTRGGHWNFADVNGDGRQDYLFASGADRASATLRYRLSLEDGAFGPAVNTGISAALGIGTPFDANGDGRSDLLVAAPNGRWAIAYGGASGLGAATDTGIALPAGLRDFRGADMNGDGLGDIAWSEVIVPTYNVLTVHFRAARAGGGFAQPVQLYSQWETLGYTQAEGGTFIGEAGRRIDLDGDGSEELLMDEEYTIARISDRQHATDRPDVIVRGVTPLDFNDDGCTDIAYKHVTSGTLRIRTSACAVTAPVADILGGDWSGGHDPQALDWNGDGRDDVLMRGPVNWLVSLSQGDSLAPFVDTGVPHEGAMSLTGRDIDGDGLEDIALRSATQVRARLRAGAVPDLLVAATDGLGVTARFTYRPLTDPAVHAAGGASGWPEPFVQTNEIVVTEMRTTDGSGGGGTLRTELRYEGLRVNAQGRGSLGFRKVVRTERGDGESLVSVLTRRQDFPYTGLAESFVVQHPSGIPIASTETSWSRIDYGSGFTLRRFPYPKTVTVRRFGSGGAHDGVEIVRSVRSVAAVDAASGLVADETTTTTEMAGGANGGSSASLRTLHGAVLNDIANWCLGRTQAVEITASHTLAAGAPLVRSAEQSWSGPKCRPTRFRLFPGDAALQVTHDLGYDSFGNVASEKVTGIGMSARTVTTSWGARGRLPVRVTNPLGQASTYAWDEGSGLPQSFTDPNGLTTRWEYDAFGRPLRETLQDGTRSEWTRETCKAACDPRARYRIRQDELDAGGVVRATAWLEVDQHERGFRLEAQQPGGGSTVTRADSDSRGRTIRHHLPHWDGTQPPGHVAWTHDALGRVLSERLVAASGAIERSREFRHDGLTVTESDALGRTRSSTRTAWGSPSEEIDAAGGRTRYDFDAFGRPGSVRDALGNRVVALGYDARGRQVAAHDMDLGDWQWTRNALGEVASIRDARGATTRFERDALGRITQRTSAEGTATWTWGAAASKRNIGRLASLSAPGYAESYIYDGAGRPATQTVTTDAAYRFDFTYNALGLLDEFAWPAVPSQGRLRIRHDYEAGRLTRIRDAGAGSLWTLNAQDAAGNALDETLGSAVRVVSGFSPLTGLIDYRQAGVGGGAGIQDLAFGWDPAGNLAWRRDLGQALLEEFRYDALDRLTQSRRNGAANLELEYDPIGNIRRKSDICPGTSACYVYDANRRHAVVSAGGRNFAYDANGNMTQRAGGAISWNADNLPVSVAGDAGGESLFSYAPDGSRWRQVARQGGVTETTVYAGGLFEKATKSGNTTWRHYVTAPGGTVVMLKSSDGSAPAVRVLTLDHLGSTAAVNGAAGEPIAVASFGAFGSRRGASGTGLPTAAELAKLAAVTRDGFTGHEMLDNVGLIHMNGRIYDPALGRFLSADPYVTRPFDGQGFNRYAYVLNNPLTFADPSGFDPVPCLATQDGHCVQITVIAASWSQALRLSGGAHAAEVASALERDPCGQNGAGLACSMPGLAQTLPAGVVLTVGRQPDGTLSTGGRLDAVQGFAARIANLAISTSPIALLFGADPDFQYFREPDSAYGNAGSMAGNVGYLAGGALGVVRRGAGEALAAPSQFARSRQGTAQYPGVDSFRDITLKKGKIIYAGWPGQGHFYTTASAIRRAGGRAEILNQGLQIAPHRWRPTRVRYAAFEVLEDTPAAFGLAIANNSYGSGWFPQVVVPSYQTTLKYLGDFPLGQ